jgi:hypothetical protein
MKLHELTDLAHKVWGDRPGDETPFFADLERFAALVEAHALEKFADTVDELTNKSLHAQLNAVAAEREACADIAENWRCNGCPRTVLADQIRARGKE